MIKKMPFVKKIYQSISRRSIKDCESTLIYIHIGKCGGASLWTAILESKKLKQDFTTIHKVHVDKPPLLLKARYLIVVRNPIQRAISAFNWRYKLVVKDEVQKNRFDGEWEILKKYGTLNTLAEALYIDGNLNDAVAKEFKSIHHLKEDISFYLSDLLPGLESERLVGMLSAESLNEDIKRQLDVNIVERAHENSSSTPVMNKKLSEVAHQNLKEFLAEDYECIEKLLEINSKTSANRDDLLK